MKIDNTSYNVEAIKAMTFEEFKEIYKGVLKQDAKIVYNAITKENTKSIKEVRENKPDVFNEDFISRQGFPKTINGPKHKRPATRKGN